MSVQSPTWQLRIEVWLWGGGGVGERRGRRSWLQVMGEGGGGDDQLAGSGGAGQRGLGPRRRMAV